MDRVDRRDGLLYILDYKTGTIKKHDGSLWTDLSYFARAENLCGSLMADATGDPARLEQLEDLFDELRTRLPSLQLPCYLSMAGACGMAQLGDAALVELRDSGKEHPLFGGLVDDDLNAALGFCRSALTLTLMHMVHAPSFSARPDKHCQWCPYSGLCSI